MGLRASRTSQSIVFGASSAAQHPRTRAELVDRATGGSLTTLLVASTGGHLKQLHRLHRRLAALDGPLRLGDLRHPAEPLAAGRGGRSTSSPSSAAATRATSPATCRRARRILRSHEVDTMVSTGSAVALPFFALGRARAAALHYIESAARSEGPSLTGQADLPDPRRPPLLPSTRPGPRGAGAFAARCSTPSPAPSATARRGDARSARSSSRSGRTRTSVPAADRAPARAAAARGRGPLADRRHRRLRVPGSRPTRDPRERADGGDGGRRRGRRPRRRRRRACRLRGRQVPGSRAAPAVAYGEHVDDHQIQIAAELGGRGVARRDRGRRAGFRATCSVRRTVGSSVFRIPRPWKPTPDG